MVEERGEPRVVLVRADVPLPRQPLHSLREVPVGEDVRQAEGGEVHAGELREVDALGVVALGAEVEQDAELLDPEEKVVLLLILAAVSIILASNISSDWGCFSLNNMAMLNIAH